MTIKMAFLLSLQENGFTFRPLTLKKICPLLKIEEFNYGVLDLFIVWSGRIGLGVGDERRDRVLSLPNVAQGQKHCSLNQIKCRLQSGSCAALSR